MFLRTSLILVSLFFLNGIEAQPQQNTPRVASMSKTNTETGDFRIDMLAAVNAVRASGCKCGNKVMPPVPPLKWNSELEAAAIRHALDMAKHKHFDHIGTDGSEFDKRITEAGYLWQQIGENIAFGYDSIGEAMFGWKNSASHCRQLMSPKVNELGAARHGKYWVQEFGKQRGK
jgi:uncharacterized protein YkwD